MSKQTIIIDKAVDHTGTISAPALLVLPRGSITEVVVEFRDGGTPELFDAGATLNLHLYAPGDTVTPIANGSILSGSAHWTRDTANNRYQATLDLRNSVAIAGNLNLTTLFAKIEWEDSTVPTGSQATALVHVQYGSPQQVERSAAALSLADQARRVPWSGVEDKPDVATLVSDQVSTQATSAKATSVTALKAIDVSSLTNGDLRDLQGYYGVNTPGGGLFELDNTGTVGGSLEDGGLLLYANDGKANSASDKAYWRRVGWDGNAAAFGAKGDGTTDDAAAIQAAIDARETTGGDVYLPAGVHAIGTGLTIESEGVILRGIGREESDDAKGSVLKATAAIDMVTFGYKSGATARECRRSRLLDLQLDCNATATYGAKVVRPKAELRGVNIRDTIAAGAGMLIQSFSVVVDSCSIFDNAGHGIHVQQDSSETNVANDIRIRNNIISGNGKHGVFLDAADGGGDGIWITGNNMENNCGAGDAGTPYAHIFVGSGYRKVFLKDNYHESDLSQTGYGSQRFYKVEGGAEHVVIRDNQMSCANNAANRFDHLIEIGAAAIGVEIANNLLGEYAITAIKNSLGVSGFATLRHNTLVQGGTTKTGYQSELIDSGASIETDPNFNFLRAHLSAANQSIANSTITKLEFDSQIDPTGAWDTGDDDWTAPEEGYYLVVFEVEMDVIPATVEVDTYLYKNNAVAVTAYHVASGTLKESYKLTDIIKLEAGDTLDFRVQHQRGSNVNARVNGTRCAVQKISSQFANQA